jgi:PPP family 3-phenylpropionic acid transporter
LPGKVLIAKAPLAVNLPPVGTPIAARLSLLYAALFLVVGFYLPYMPVWLHFRGMSEDAIALLLAAPLFVRILSTPAISFAADRAKDRRAILLMLGCGSLLSFVALWAADGFWTMLAATILLAICWTTIMPLIETVAVAGIRKQGLDYGRVRLWGSASFILASFGAGFIIERWGPATILPLLLAATVLMLVGTMLLPKALTAKTRPTDGVHRHLKLSEAMALFRAPLFLLFLFATSAVQASHAVYYAFGTIAWQRQGFSAEAIGALWAFGVIVEIVLFAFSGRLIARLGAARLLGLASLAATIRWGAMAFEPPLLVTALVQSLHAFSFGAAHLAAIHFLTHAVPEDRAATAQGIYAAAVAGLAMGPATIASGPLYRLFGPEAYAAMAALAFISVLSAALLMRRWHGGLVVAALELHPHSAGAGGKTSPEA